MGTPITTPFLPVGIFLVAFIPSVLHHLIVSHRGGRSRDLHPSQTDPRRKGRKSWRSQSGEKKICWQMNEESRDNQGSDDICLYTKNNYRLSGKKK